MTVGGIDMSTQITTAFVKQFGTNVFHLSQQKGSKLRNAVRTESVKGESRAFERIGKVEAMDSQGRHADTPQQDTPHTRRWVHLVDKEHGDLIDDQDKVRTLIDPTNEYVVAAMWAMGRAMDRAIIAAADGVVRGGKEGSDLVTHPNTQKIGSVNAASSAVSLLNVQALRRAKKILDGNDVAEEIPRYFALDALQLDDGLLAQTEVTSSDYNSVKALVMGQVNTYMGFNFIRTELLGTQSGSLAYSYTTGAVGSGSGDADGHKKCIAWAKDGLLLGIGEDMNAQVAPNPAKRFATQIYVKESMGATRMEEEKVVIVLADQG